MYSSFSFVFLCIYQVALYSILIPVWIPLMRSTFYSAVTCLFFCCRSHWSGSVGSCWWNAASQSSMIHPLLSRTVMRAATVGFGSLSIGVWLGSSFVSLLCLDLVGFLFWSIHSLSVRFLSLLDSSFGGFILSIRIWLGISFCWVLLGYSFDWFI